MNYPTPPADKHDPKDADRRREDRLASYNDGFVLGKLQAYKHAIIEIESIIESGGTLHDAAAEIRIHYQHLNKTRRKNGQEEKHPTTADCSGVDPG